MCKGLSQIRHVPGVLFSRSFKRLLMLACAIGFSGAAEATELPNIYGFPFPPGFAFDHSPFPGNELWKGARAGDTLQIGRISDLKQPLATYAQAAEFLKDMMRIRQRGLLGIANGDFQFESAKYHFNKAKHGWEFALSGQVRTTFGVRVRFIERWYVVGRQSYELIYTENENSLRKISQIETQLNRFWPTDAVQ